jgi:hypothetical protein
MVHGIRGDGIPMPIEKAKKRALTAYRKHEVETGKLTAFEAEYKKALAAHRKREVGTGKLTTFEECLMKGGEAAFTAGWEAALKAIAIVL